VIGVLIPQEDGSYKRVERPIDGSSESSPAVAPDGSIYICDGRGNVLGYTRALEKMKWSYHLGSESLGSISIDTHGALYVVGGKNISKSGATKLIDKQDSVEEAWVLGNGKLKRGSETEDSPVRRVTSLILTTTGGVGYFTGAAEGKRAQGRVFAFDIETGRVISQANFDSPAGFCCCIPVNENTLVAFTSDLLDVRYREGLLGAAAGIRVYKRMK
jgi:outer membrane protein assembly factor BamB